MATSAMNSPSQTLTIAISSAEGVEFDHHQHVLLQCTVEGNFASVEELHLERDSGYACLK